MPMRSTRTLVSKTILAFLLLFQIGGGCQNNYHVVASAPIRIPLVVIGRVAKLAIPYYTYCIAVHKYAEHKVNLWKDIPTNFEEEEGGATVPKRPIMKPNDLRKTISKRCNLVLNTQDRVEWNRYITSSSLSTKKKSMLPPCGTYQFSYRTYVNFEEVGGFCKPFYTTKRFGMIQKVPDRLFISEGDDGNLHVTMTGHFSRRLVLSTTIKWFGTIVPTSKYGYTIMWTSTEFQDGRKKPMKDHPVTKQLSAIPWEIRKVEDGMICLRRGDVGYLVFDLVEK